MKYDVGAVVRQMREGSYEGPKPKKAAAGLTGCSVTSVIVPLTRGSTTTLRPVRVARVRATASMLALTKFRVTGSPRLAAPAGACAPAWACEFE